MQRNSIIFSLPSRLHKIYLQPNSWGVVGERNIEKPKNIIINFPFNFHRERKEAKMLQGNKLMEYEMDVNKIERTIFLPTKKNMFIFLNFMCTFDV